METSQIPIRYILVCRRILYLKTILQRGAEELISQLYAAQEEEPTKGDFCELASKDKELLDISLSDNHICLKSLVKTKARYAAFTNLNNIKETKSKLNNISYHSTFKILPYMQCMSREQASLLLALRTRTIRGIRSEFGDMYLDKGCPLPGCREETPSLTSSPAGCCRRQ